HVVAFLHTGQQDDVVYLVMEVLEGMSLEGRLTTQAPWQAAESVRLAREIATGLAAVHQRKLIHRDIKPANIWLESKVEGGGTSPFRVKIFDFGLVRAVTSGVQLTGQNALLGTPAYMAPEQARGEPATEQSDLFSLGCVLYRVCTGNIPFPGQN